jgi:hypothetical protein
MTADLLCHLQSVYERLLEERVTGDAQARLDVLSRLQGFSNLASHELNKMMVQYKVSIEKFSARSLICAQGHSMDQVRLLCLARNDVMHHTSSSQ